MLFVKLSPLIALFLLGCKYEMFVSPFNRITQLFSFLLACIPIIGVLYVFCLICAFCANYNERPDQVDYVNGKPLYEVTNDDDYIYVRDTKLNRLLFNDINWTWVDCSIQHSIEQHNIEMEKKLREEQENHE